MFVLERIIEVIAPHDCLGCGREGYLLCVGCFQSEFPPLPDRCYMCHALSRNAALCSGCRRKSPLGHVWVRSEYDGLAKPLVGALKFSRASAASGAIAKLMVETLPRVPKDAVIVPLPSATARVRQRGYDHTWLIARDLAAITGLRASRLLGRLGQSRQVGATRALRRQQLQGAFWVKDNTSVLDAHLILVDDVVTTGASLESAAITLKQAGAKRVDAIVFAQKQS